jgi:integrase
MDAATFDDQKAFVFTEQRLEELLRAIGAGRIATKADGRRWYRDDGSADQLYVAVSKSGATFYRIATQRGKKIYKRLGDATRMRVTAARSEAKKHAAGEESAGSAPIRIRTGGPTVREAWDRYFADATAGRYVAGKTPTRASTLASYRNVFTPHVLEPIGNKPLTYLAKRAHAMLEPLHGKPATYNRLCLIIRLVFNHAIDAGTWSEPHPLINRQTGRPSVKRKTLASRERYLSTEETARLLAFAAGEREPWPVFWKLLLLTGVRVSNLRLARWDEISLHGHAEWRIPMTKNNRPLTVPLTATAAAILAARKAAATTRTGKPASDWVFPCPHDPTIPMRKVCHAWERMREATSMADIRIHDLRRTCGSWAVQGGANLADVGRLLGHASSNVTLIYARADTAGARRAAEIVERRLEEAERLVVRRSKPKRRAK